MSLLLRSIIVRGRPVLRAPFIRKAPCFSRRLGSPDVWVLCRSASSASATCLPHLAVDKNIASDNQPVPSINSPISGIRFQTREANYYHRCLENSSHYNDTIFTKHDLEALLIPDLGNVDHLLKTEDWSCTSTSDIVEAFRTITSYARANELVISNPQFDSICSAISGRHKEFADEEMIEIGKLHTLWIPPPSSTEKNYELLRQSLDDFFVFRYTKEWYTKRNFNKILQAADIFYWQRWGARSHFLRVMIYHLGVKAKEHHHLIQIMFYLGLLRNIPETFKIYDLEKKVFSIRDKCSLSELVVVVNSLFRAKSKIQYYPLIEELLLRTLKNFSSLDDYLLTTISKGCHHAPRELRPLLALLQRRLTANFSNFGIGAIIHAMWTFVKVGVIDEHFAQLVYNRSMNSFSDLRTKEMTKLIIMFTEIESPERDLKYLADKILVELENFEKLDWFQKKDFISGAVLHRCLICGSCPEKLLNDYLKSIDQSSLTSKTLSSVEKSKEALGIDVHLEAFYPNYTGARLDPDIKKAIYEYRFQGDSNDFVKSTGKMGKRSTFNLRCVESIQASLLQVLQGREDNMLVKQLVPSFGYLDVVLRINKEGKFLPIPEEMKSEPWNITKIPIQHIEDGEKFLALTFIQYPDEYTSRKISCFQREKKNILQKLGYLHKDVSVRNWINATASQQQTNLQTVISELLNK